MIMVKKRPAHPPGNPKEKFSAATSSDNTVYLHKTMWLELLFDCLKIGLLIQSSRVHD